MSRSSAKQDLGGRNVKRRRLCFPLRLPGHPSQRAGHLGCPSVSKGTNLAWRARCEWGCPPAVNRSTSDLRRTTDDPQGPESSPSCSHPTGGATRRTPALLEITKFRQTWAQIRSTSKTRPHSTRSGTTLAFQAARTRLFPVFGNIR